MEEAHHVLYGQRKKESLLEQLLRQCRELGIAFVVVDQHPHLISSAALGNTYTTICLNLKDPKDLSRAAGVSLLEDREKDYLSMLPVGQGIVKLQDRWRKPFLLQFPLLEIAKGAVTDEGVRRYLRANSTRSGVKQLIDMQFGQVRQVRIPDRVLEEEELRFIEDVLKHRDDGVKARYRRLAFSVDRGNRLKNELSAEGWLEQEVVPIGRTRKVLLRVSPSAKQALGLDSSSPEAGIAKESLAHEYWKRFYARLYAGKGYTVELEAHRHGGRVDVLACRGSERVGIEVETGKSDVVGNVRNCLRSRFDRVIVVATDESALRKVEKKLATAGLIIPGRVEIAMREE